MTKNLLTIAGLAILAAGFTSCKKDNSEGTKTPSYTIPATYNFSNVDYSDQTTRFSMSAEIEAEMKKGTTAGTVVSAQKLKDMLANANSPFTAAANNASALNLKSWFPAQAVTDVEAYMDSLETASHSTQQAANGVAGVGTSAADATKKYLLSANGINYAQFYSKTLMGVITYQIINNAFGAATMGSGVDNNTVVAGKGTAMEHNWDLAFGLWMVPVDFPTNKTGVKYWGSYSSQVDSGLHCNATLMTAYLTGRAAISNKDMATRDAQITTICQTYEKMQAAAAIHELNAVKLILSTDLVKSVSTISESMAFVASMRYNPKKQITDAQISQVLGYYGTNLYNISIADINNIINTLSSIYGFDSVKNII